MPRRGVRALWRPWFVEGSPLGVPMGTLAMVVTVFQHRSQLNCRIDLPALRVPVRPESLDGIKNAIEVTLCIVIDLHDVNPEPGNLP